MELTLSATATAYVTNYDPSHTSKMTSQGAVCDWSGVVFDWSHISKMIGNDWSHRRLLLQKESFIFLIFGWNIF